MSALFYIWFNSYYKYASIYICSQTSEPLPTSRLCMSFTLQLPIARSYVPRMASPLQKVLQSCTTYYTEFFVALWNFAENCCYYLRIESDVIFFLCCRVQKSLVKGNTIMVFYRATNQSLRMFFCRQLFALLETVRPVF